MGNLPLSCVRGVEDTPQRKKTIAISIGCLPEFEGKTYCGRQHILLGTGLGAIKLELVWKPPS